MHSISSTLTLTVTIRLLYYTLAAQNYVPLPNFRVKKCEDIQPHPHVLALLGLASALGRPVY